MCRTCNTYFQYLYIILKLCPGCLFTLIGVFHCFFRLEVTLQEVISMDWCMRTLSSNTRSCCPLAAGEQSPTSLHQEIMTSLWVKFTIILTRPEILSHFYRQAYKCSSHQFKFICIASCKRNSWMGKLPINPILLNTGTSLFIVCVRMWCWNWSLKE